MTDAKDKDDKTEPLRADVRAHLVNRPWFLEHEEDRGPHQVLYGLISQMKRRQEVFLSNTRTLMAAFQWGAKASPAWEEDCAPLDDSTNYYNVAQNLIETVHAKVCKNEVRPMALPEGNGYLARRRARRLDNAVTGVLDDQDFDATVEDVVMDALTTDHGAGAVLCFREHGKIKLEWLPIDDLFVDDAEARTRKPRCLYRRIRMDRFVALEKFGGDEDGLWGDVEERRRKILTAPSAKMDSFRNVESDQIELWEAWHLRSRPAYRDRAGSSDGRHCIIIDGYTLVDEDWCRDRFPVAIFCPRPRRRHMWGLSLMRALMASQREHEVVSEKLQRSHEKQGGAIWWTPDQEIDPRELANGFGYAVGGSKPPQLLSFPVIDEQVYRHRDGVAALMSQHTGISQLSASSQIPSGLQQASGKALQTFDDFEGERLMPYHKAKERLTLDVWWLIVDEAEELVEEDGEAEVTYRGKDSLETLRWKELLGKRVENDNGELVHYKRDFSFRVFPVSDLAKKPSAKFEQLQEMFNSKAITVQQFKRLFNIPDLEAENELDTADVDVIDWAVDRMVVEGKYVSPEQTDNFQLAISRASSWVNLLRQQEGIPEERIGLVLQYIDDVRKLVEAAQPPAPAGPPPGPPGMPPPGAPPPMPSPGGMPPGGPPPMPMAA